MKQPLPDTPMVSLAELAAAAGCSIHTARRAVKPGGDLADVAKLIANTWMVPRESAVDWAAEYVPYRSLRISKGGRAGTPPPGVPAHTPHCNSGQQEG